jgi:hypothetical protein
MRDWRGHLRTEGKQGKKRDANDSSAGGSLATAMLRRVRKERNDEVQPRGTNETFAQGREWAKKTGRQSRERTLKVQAENCD